MTNWTEINWLASYPKSGNTWARLVLDAYILGELNLNEIIASVSDDNARRYQIGGGMDIREFPIHLQGLMRPASLLRLVCEYKKSTIGTPLIVKTHNPNSIINGIEQLPEALTRSIVYFVRNPISVVPSFARHMGQSLDDAIESVGKKHNVLSSTGKENKVADPISSWEFNVRSYLDNQDPFLLVRYEEMQETPEKAFGEIIKYVGLELDEERLSKALEMTDLEKLKEREKKEGFYEASPHADGFFGATKEKLNRNQRRKIERKMGRVMKRLGYL